MVGLTLAIGEFMMMLISASLWTAGGFAVAAIATAGALGGLAALVWRWRR